jgi:ferritin-like metal-binding protein YciE
MRDPRSRRVEPAATQTRRANNARACSRVPSQQKAPPAQELAPRLARCFGVSRRGTRLDRKTKQSGDAVMKTMDQLFHALLQDVYYAEKELTKALPKMAKEADNEELKKAFTDHLKETEGHVERLEKAFEMIGKTAKGKKCDAILGIVAEGKEVMDEVDDEQTLGAALIAAGQAAEHYEIARYGTLCAWAKLIGKPQIARLLHETLEEEKNADALLTKIAERSVNEQAVA